MKGKGRGVFAMRPFKRDEPICEYSGELISSQEAKRREELYSKNPSAGCFMYYFTFKMKRLWYVGFSNSYDCKHTAYMQLVQIFVPSVDATYNDGRPGRLVNHSRMKKLANVIAKVVDVEGTPHLYLIAG